MLTKPERIEISYGYCWLVPLDGSGEVAEISDLWVDPGERHQGRGSLLINTALELAKTHGVKMVQAHIQLERIAWWRKFGLRLVETEAHIEIQLGR